MLPVALERDPPLGPMGVEWLRGPPTAYQSMRMAAPPVAPAAL
jgi:hypothetical protein